MVEIISIGKNKCTDSRKPKPKSVMDRVDVGLVFVFESIPLRKISILQVHLNKESSRIFSQIYCVSGVSNTVPGGPEPCRV